MTALRAGAATGEGMPSFALIADANDGARAELARLVARLGYVIVEAVTGEQALEIVRDRTPALVVLDVGLERGQRPSLTRPAFSPIRRRASWARSRARLRRPAEAQRG